MRTKEELIKSFLHFSKYPAGRDEFFNSLSEEEEAFLEEGVEEHVVKSAEEVQKLVEEVDEMIRNREKGEQG